MSSTQPSPTPPSPRDVGPKLIVGFALLLLVIVFGVVVFLPTGIPRPNRGGTTAAGGGAKGVATPHGPVALSIEGGVPVPSVIVDVYDGKKAVDAARKNAWLQQTLAQPLGRGFVGPWAGFLGTRGGDLKGSGGSGFEGAVADLLADKLLAQPFRVVWFEGSDARSTPVMVIPSPSSAAEGAFAALDAAAQRGTYTAQACPVAAPAGSANASETETATPESTASAAVAKATPPPQFTVSRWVIADQSVYGVEGKSPDGETRMALARLPAAAVMGVCTALPALAQPARGDVEVTFAPNGLGREAQSLVAMLGVSPSPRLDFGIDGDHLVARGVTADKADEAKLDVAPLSEDLLKAIPEDVPVVLAMQVKLPDTLDAQLLAQHFSGDEKERPKTITRQVALLWNPHGDDRTSEVALLWSRKEDAAALHDVFSGDNKMVSDSLCGQEVFASVPAMLERVRKACNGKTPSMVHAAPDVVASLKSPASITLLLESGRLLSGVTADAWTADKEKSGPTPAEITDAEKQLEALPTFVLVGAQKSGSLVAGGQS